MEPRIAIGESHSFALREALLIYQSDRGSYITRHNVTAAEGKRPELGPPQALSRDFLKTLSQELGTHLPVEVFSADVLARTDSLVAWWTQAQSRPMFFQDAEKRMTPLSGRVFPHPALVFVAANRSLYVRALDSSRRPDAATPLFVAPYWNTYKTGNVCLGSMRAPDSTTVASIPAWETGFFESAFTHPSDAGKLTNYERGFRAMWKHLAGSQQQFPSRYLVDARQTLSQFLQSIDTNSR